MKSVFYQLIEEHTKTLMLTEVNDEYVFKRIGNYYIPEKPSTPSKAVLLIVCLFVSLGMSISYIIVINIFKRPNTVG